MLVKLQAAFGISLCRGMLVKFSNVKHYSKHLVTYMFQWITSVLTLGGQRMYLVTLEYGRYNMLYMRGCYNTLINILTLDITYVYYVY